MEIWLLVAKPWHSYLCSRSQLSPRVAKLIATPRTTHFASYHEMGDRHFSLVELDWKTHTGESAIKKGVDLDAELGRVYARRQAAEFTANVFLFQVSTDRVKLSNGMTVKFETQPKWNGDGKFIKESRDKITYKGNLIASGCFITHGFFHDKFCLKEVLDKNKAEFAYHVVDFGPSIVSGTPPVLREIVREGQETDPRQATLFIEKDSGNLWWNTRNAIMREGNTIFELPQGRMTSSFEVLKEHVIIFDHQNAPKGTPQESEAQDNTSCTVFNWRLRHRLLRYACEKGRGFNGPTINILERNLALFTLLTKEHIEFRLLSGKRASAVGILALEKVRSPSINNHATPSTSTLEVVGKVVHMYLHWGR